MNNNFLFPGNDGCKLKRPTYFMNIQESPCSDIPLVVVKPSKETHKVDRISFPKRCFCHTMYNTFWQTIKVGRPLYEVTV